MEDKVRILKESLGSHFSWIDPKQRGAEIADEVVKTFAERTTDPSILYNAKRKLINEILDFNISPRLYVQTNPKAGSELTSGSSVEVFGWAEPGTKIAINRRILPVSAEGLFLEQFGLTARNNSIIVIAEKDGKSKEIVREFKIR
jgi:hypothetical protein